MAGDNGRHPFFGDRTTERTIQRLSVAVRAVGFNMLVIDLPSCIPQQGGNPPVAIPSILSDQFNRVGNEPFLIDTASRDMTLGRSVLAQHAAGSALRNTKLAAKLINATPAARRAQKFPLQLRKGSTCRESDLRLPYEDARSPSEAVSVL